MPELGDGDGEGVEAALADDQPDTALKLAEDRQRLPAALREAGLVLLAVLLPALLEAPDVAGLKVAVSEEDATEGAATELAREAVPQCACAAAS